MQNNIYSVCQVNNYLKNMIVTDHFLSNVSVRGEISNCKYYPSGHIYFTLKDAESALSGVMFSGKRSSGLKFKLSEGMQVVVSGNLDVYVRDGKYQIYANKIEQEGVGNIYEQFEKLKNKLEEMGLFAPEYKQPIPKYNKVIGVVTASSGAAVRDIIDVSKRRNPGIQIILYPAVVQGEACPESVVAGIKALDAYGVDTIIVGRGGGSIEDLWGFNDERVAQAIFDCATPVISAVGHETDFTIADYVADLRAPTPSAAAELAVCDVKEHVLRLEGYKNRLDRDINKNLQLRKVLISRYKDKIEHLSPISKLNEKRNRLMHSGEKLNSLMNNKLISKKHKLEILAGKLNGLSPLNKLGGGYAYVESKGSPIKSIGDVKVDDLVEIKLTDGSFEARVEKLS